MTSPLSKHHPKEEDSACCNPFSAATSEEANKQQQDGDLTKEIAEEMYSLSLQEREKATDDVHGVATMQEETPEFIEECLQSFNDALKRLPGKMKTSATKAFFLKPSLETDRDFKLMFLRADEYQAVNAAIRMVNFFKQKSVLFGEDKLVKRITMDDLSEDDMMALRSGHILLLPLRDQIGRPMLLFDNSKIDFIRLSSDCMTRSFWYVAMALMRQDEVGQKKGIAAISYGPGSDMFKFNVIGKATYHTMRSGAFVRTIPLRFTGLHWCYSDPRIEMLIRTMRMSHDKDFRLRVRPHYGSELENEYKLMSYGIQSKGLLQGARAGDKTLLHQYLQRRQEADQQFDNEIARQEAELGITPYPKPEDVLIGRGGPYRVHPGNKVWDKLIISNLDRYVKSSKFEKTCISMETVKNFHESGGRFLHRSEEGWKVLDDVNAREKAAIGFRSRGGGGNSKTTPPRLVSPDEGYDPKRLRAA